MIEGVFSARTCTGYRAASIEIERRDVLAMIRLLDGDPETLRKMLVQLEMRWA